MPKREKKVENGDIPQSPREGIGLPIQRTFPESLPPLPSNHFVIQTSEHEAHLFFFHIRPPIILGSDADLRRAASELTHVTAECVAEIVIPITRLPELTRVFVDTLNKVTTKIGNPVPNAD
jgi:hypothetical protein